MDRTKEQKQELSNSFGDKWIVTYTEEDGKKCMAFCGAHRSLISIIEIILEQNGTDIKIEDQTPWRISDI